MGVMQWPRIYFQVRCDLNQQAWKSLLVGVHACTKVIRICFAMSKQGIFVSMYRYEIFQVVFLGPLHLLWEIS